MGCGALHIDRCAQTALSAAAAAFSSNCCNESVLCSSMPSYIFSMLAAGPEILQSTKSTFHHHHPQHFILAPSILSSTTSLFSSTTTTISPAFPCSFSCCCRRSPSPSNHRSRIYAKFVRTRRFARLQRFFSPFPYPPAAHFPRRMRLPFRANRSRHSTPRHVSSRHQGPISSSPRGGSVVVSSCARALANSSCSRASSTVL